MAMAAEPHGFRSEGVSPPSPPGTSLPALSADQLIKGVSFDVRYVGCMEIPVSMKTLDFDVRTKLAKECIFRITEAAKYITARKNRQVDRKVKSVLGSTTPNLNGGGEDVELLVSSRALSVLHADSKRILFSHSMPNISFASGGDEETSDFVAFVGKEESLGRCCFVFECGITLAPTVLTTIGQAFSLRFQEFQRKAVPIHDSTGAPPLHTPPISDPSLPDPRQGSGYVNDAVVGCQADRIHEMDEVLSREIWYHGRMSREEAERLLKEDGDFLVRNSAKEPEQFVLTGRQNGSARHLLLMDAEGKVRTRDREFQSVSHLIHYHRDNNIPITSAESALLLRNPVLPARP